MILLDTHIWVRWLISDDLDAKVVDLIENVDEVAVSAISCWEVIYLEKKGRLKLPVPSQEWLDAGLQQSQISCLPMDRQVAALSANLPDHHRDPADRIIIATAIIHKLKLISLDAQFKKYKELDGWLV
jgi:PIN domain nuclease of toxin-antitoxin system